MSILFRKFFVLAVIFLLSLRITSDGGTVEAAGLAGSITWSGDYKQCARTLKFTLAASAIEQGLPVVPVQPGAAVTFSDGGRLLFDGFVVSRQKSTGQNFVTVTCYDRGFYLAHNQAVKQYKNQTPESIARGLCSEFGIEVGQIAAAGILVTRNFIGVSLYQIIQTAYTLAARENGKAYQLRFSGRKLDVLEIEKNNETLVIEPGVNLQSAAMTDSIENTVTRAAVYDKNNQLVQTVDNAELLPLYGVIQRIVKQADGKDAGAEAKKLLADNGLKQTMTIECLGNLQNITGNTVAVYEPYTGIYGLFWITADTHTWKNGQYFNRLTLSVKRLMDEVEAGSLPNKRGKKTASSSGSGRKIHVDNSGYWPYIDSANQKGG